MDEHPQARFIVETLASAGFVAYYAGGWVRDLLLNHPSDDIDIATNASPEIVQALFPHTIPIGLAFGIILVIIEGRQYEVATFRQDLDYKDGRRPTKIEFTTAVEDAKRRDFTINGMFYDPLKEQILDFVGGKEDLDKKLISAIGDPHKRIQEDRLRMIRAIRLACRFSFKIEKNTELAIRSHVKELFPAVAIERVWQEFKKSHDFGYLRSTLIHLHEFGLLQEIFPALNGIELSKIKERLEPIKDYPQKAPVIASILALFLDTTLDEQQQLCKTLKLSNSDLSFTTFLYHARTLTQLDRPVERIEWGYFYANVFAPVCLQIISTHMPARKRVTFLKEHETQMQILETSIQRIKKQDPIIKSDDLKKLGIEPSPLMGQLLQEAERISINEQIYEPALILKRLRELSIWPK